MEVSRCWISNGRRDSLGGILCDVETAHWLGQVAPRVRRAHRSGRRRCVAPGQFRTDVFCAGHDITHDARNMSDKRVEFDFEVDFSNGGGLQGQAFRLDLDGDTLEDDALAAFIIRDLRLLMVGGVRILNKRIVTERHKRSAAPESGAGHGPIGDLIDLSHVIESGMITYKGLPAPLICDHLSREQSRRVYAEGTEFQIGRIDMVSNTGTYLDTPYHRYADGVDLAGVGL